jgi:hypothetical protein
LEAFFWKRKTVRYLDENKGIIRGTREWARALELTFGLQREPG